jgi:hypothetical protein
MAEQRSFLDREQVLVGTFIDAPTSSKIRIRQSHLCVISSTGRILHLHPSAATDEAAIRQELPEQWKTFPVHILSPTQFIAPGMVDCHLQ